MSQTKTEYTEGQNWGALRKCWRGYRIAKTHGEMDRMIDYAKKIRSLQRRMGISVAEFPNLNLDLEATEKT